MIKMIRGVFGLPVNGIVKAMDKNSGAFEAGAEQEARLVRLGLAVKVETEDSEPAPADEVVDTTDPIGMDEMPPLPETPAYSVDMKATELREIGKQFGLTFKVGMSKDEMVAALDKYFAENTIEDEDGEPAPVFDAAEAVQ